MSIILMAAGIIGSIVAIFLIIWKIFDSMKKDKRVKERMKKRDALEEALQNKALYVSYEDTFILEYEEKKISFGIGDKITIGRGQDNVVVLADGRISKRHCTIFQSCGNMMILDDGSKNGTIIDRNGTIINVNTAGERLENGDRIILGKARLLYKRLSISA